MRWKRMYLAGTGCALPASVPVRTAIADGRYSADEAARTQQRGVAVADEHTASPHLAVAAARHALTHSGCPPDELGLLLHGLVFHTGLDVWNSAAYLQRELGILGNRCLVAEVRSGCNSGLVGLELACSFLAARTNSAAAVVAVADCWPSPGFDRWHSEPGLVYGDAGAALVVSTRGGFARVLATATATEPQLEALHRGDDPFRVFGQMPSEPIRLSLRARAFLRSMSRDEVRHRQAVQLRAVVDEATADAGVPLSDIKHVALPFYGARLLRNAHLDRLGVDPSQTAWEFGRNVGHAGGVDVLAGLDYFVRTGRLRSGDHVLLLGEGAGFICTAAVLVIENDPQDAAHERS